MIIDDWLFGILILSVIIGIAMAISFLAGDGGAKTSSAQQNTNAETPPVQSGRDDSNSPGTLSGIFWILSLLCSIGAVITLVGGLIESESAIQQGAVGAIAAAIAVIPYCVARAVSELGAK